MPKLAEKKKRRYQFMDSASTIRNIHLGTIPDYVFNVLKGNLDKLKDSVRMGTPPDASCQKWLRDIPDELHAKIAKVGLCKARRGDTLETLIRDFIATKRGGRKERTIERWQHDERLLCEFFGPDRNVTTITRNECEKYLTWLHDVKVHRGSTLGKEIKNARMFFKHGVQSEALTRNPFADVKGSSAIDQSRKGYIPTTDIRAAMGYCPDAEWRAIFALARFSAVCGPARFWCCD